MPDWKTRDIDVDYLIDSGLLFEINRTILHLFGIAVTARTDAQGRKSLGFKDMRSEPEKLVFDKATVEMGTTKLQKYLKEFGHGQMNRRIKHHGKATQWVPQKS